MNIEKVINTYYNEGLEALLQKYSRSDIEDAVNNCQNIEQKEKLNKILLNWESSKELLENANDLSDDLVKDDEEEEEDDSSIGFIDDFVDED